MFKLARSSAGVPVCANLAQMHEGDAVAALGFVEIRRGNNDGEPFCRKMGERVPELAARNRIDAGGGLVEQEHARLRRPAPPASESFCFMPPLNLPARRSAKAVHIKHAEIVVAALG